MASGRTLDENIVFIKSTGVYGTEMREAIAEGIEQSFSDSKIAIEQIAQDIDNRDLFMSVSPIAGTDNDYLLTITNPT